jgi:hypothetical protein
MTLALVLGGASCVWDDALAALRLATPDVVLAINDMIPLWPGVIDHAVSLHPDQLPGWIAAREANSTLPAGFKSVWSHRNGLVVTKTTPDWAGSSGLFAVKVALFELNIDGVIVAGVPMTRSDHFVRRAEWLSCGAFINGWSVRIAQIKPRTRSMSGWTREQLGAPTPPWLASINARPPDKNLIAIVKHATLPK